MKHIKSALYLVTALFMVGTITGCSSPAHQGSGMAQYKNNTASSPYTPKVYQDPVFVPIQ
ncbi:MAG: hypothetical protein HQL68_06660 [Magnetococcales bacterium]|nr:hypothetical protein [Magnetococcales bacterium]